MAHVVKGGYPPESPVIGRDRKMSIEDLRIKAKKHNATLGGTKEEQKGLLV